MIAYAIWDQTSLISNRFLRQYIKDTFFEISLDFGSVPVHHDLERLIEMFNNSNHSHLVVFQSGHTSRNTRAFKEAVEEFCKRDFFVAGHIIHHVNTYPFLHPQIFILNLDMYRAFGSPMVGYHEDSEVLDLHKPERSPGNVHDDYTPLWLKPTGEIEVCMRRDFGWSFIHESLEHGIPVLNLPNRIRWSKRYIYPNDRPHMFADCLVKLAEDKLEAIPTKMNENQQNYLRELLTPGMSSMVFLFNTEKLFEPLVDIHPKRILGLAAGFKLFALWHRYEQPHEVVYYDYNRESLKVWKDIVINWSGRNFEAFCKERGYHDDFSKMQEVIDFFGGEDHLEKAWRTFQRTKPRFVHCDLLKHPEVLINEMADDNNLLWYSNCFKFYEGVRRYGLKGSDFKEEDFLKMVMEKAPDTICIGTTL